MNKEMDIEKEAAKIFLENVEKIRIQLFTIIVTAYGVLYGIVFSGQIAADILLLIPFIIMTLGMRLKFYDYSVSITGDYIQKYFTEGSVARKLDLSGESPYRFLCQQRTRTGISPIGNPFPFF